MDFVAVPINEGEEPTSEARNSRKQITMSRDRVATTASSITLADEATPLNQTEHKWEGALAFLNQPLCYANANTDTEEKSQMKRSISFAERRVMKIQAGWRRARAAFRKKGRFRPLPATAFLAGSRNCVGGIVLSPAVQGVVLLVISLDVSVILYQLMSGKFYQHHKEFEGEAVALWIIDWLVVIVLATEVLSRIFFFGAVFTHSILNLTEFGLVPLAIFELATRGEDGGGVPVPLLRTLRPILRSVSLLLKAARGLSRVRQFQRQLKMQVSGNRRRWKLDGFDLDLCYLADSGNETAGTTAASLIAMGRPAVGQATFFCNPLNEVARFFAKYHSNKYLIINVSDKIDYPIEPLHHRVLLFPVQDTCVPKLIDLWGCCQAMREFLSREKHIVAVHSRIGGGRVGLVLASYLLYSNTKRHAADAISLFERRLTEPNSNETVPGVDCASQQRFIEYFCVCVRELRYVPDPPRKARLRNIKLLGVEPEIASMLSVRCFSHTRGTAVRSAHHLNASQSFCDNGKSGSTVGGSQHVKNARPQGQDDEAALMLMHEEELMLQAQHEREAGVFDSYISGCRPQPGNPLLDTADPTQAPRDGFEGLDLLQSEVVVWPIEGLELAGEICFEIHQQIESAEGDSETKLLLAAWLHTNFLEMSAASQANRGGAGEASTMENRTICVTLQRFDLDKGANAPSLRSYGSSFEVQLLFEVDEIMEYRWGMSADDEQVEKVTGKRFAEKDILRLAPPSDSDVSDAYDGGWLTWGVKKLWPSIEGALDKKFRELLELHPITTPIGDIPITLEQFHLGDKTPELGPIYASKRSGTGEALQLDVFVRYKGDANILIKGGTSKLGVTHIGLNGTISLLFDPIVHSLPIVGGMHIYFLNPPQLVLQFIGLADPLNFHVLKSIIDEKLRSLLVDHLVLPNVLSLNWLPARMAAADSTAFQGSMLPIGVLRVVVTDVEPITPAENCGQHALRTFRCGAQCGKAQTLSRYAVLRLGALEEHQELQAQQKQVCGGCDLLVFDRKQHFTVEIWERETLGKPKMLGTSPVGGSQQMTLQDLLASRGSQWVPLDAAAGGDLGARVRLRSMLFELHADIRQLPFEEDSLRPLARKAAVSSMSFTSRLSSSAWDETLEDGSGNSPSQKAKGSINGTEVRALNALNGSTNILESKDEFPQTEDSVVALLVASLVKGRVPFEDGEEPSRYCLRVSVVDEHSDERPFTKRDTEFWKYVKLSETTTNTIEELASAGFPADRIASMLKLEKELVAKVIACRLNFNVSLPPHLYVFVPKFALAEESSITVEVIRRGKGYAKAKGQLLLSKVWGSNGMKLRSLVHLKEAANSEIEEMKDEKANYDLDMEIRLFALVPQANRKHS